MIRFLKVRLSRPFWRRFHPLVRFGWLVFRGEGARNTTVRRIGFTLIVAGLAIGRQRKKLLYAATVPADRSVRVRVVRDGRTIATG
ncbi:MAG: hypothetical protein QNJ71_03215 [Acidimicrobiia bacterium]|nr:hypothetical protein [Acidimicrobiia bacterium]